MGKGGCGLGQSGVMEGKFKEGMKGNVVLHFGR